jgi:hypothetical protein
MRGNGGYDTNKNVMVWNKQRMFPSAFIIFRLTNVNDMYRGTAIVLAM